MFPSRQETNNKANIYDRRAEDSSLASFNIGIGSMSAIVRAWPPRLIQFNRFSACPRKLCTNKLAVTIFGRQIWQKKPTIGIKQSLMSKPQPVAVSTPTENEKVYEEEYVHRVYQTIATHFSDTRYKVCIQF